MKAFDDDEITDLELHELLSAWSVPDPPLSLRARVLCEGKNRVAELQENAFTIGNGIDESWYQSLLRRIRNLVGPPEPSPLLGSAKYIALANDAGTYERGRNRSLAAALLLQAGAVAALCFTWRTSLAPRIDKRHDAVSLAFYRTARRAVRESGGGGGGEHAPAPASKGAPPPFAAKQFVPPAMSVPLPRLPVVPTITAAVPQIDAATYGDPLSTLERASGGPGFQGLGSSNGGGVGNGRGNGYRAGQGGGASGGIYSIGGEVSSPVLLSKVEPEYSEEARKSKYSGVVVLSILVDEHGLPRQIHVVRPLGLGLDEKAIEAVAHWRFRPGIRRGKAVSVIAQVEVSFRLL